MFRKILVALDRENTCEGLFEKAVKLAQAIGAELMLLSVLTPDGPNPPAEFELAYYPIGADESVWEMYQQRYREYETKGLDRLRSFALEATTAGIHAEFTQLFGSPGHMICDLARTWQADLVMVGSHGRKGLSEMLLGSVSNYVMHHAPCSVLVVHGQMTPEELVDATDSETVGQ